MRPTQTTGVGVTFFGARGSCPCAGAQTQRYGGNTSCVALQVDGEPPIILDLGTGLCDLGRQAPPAQGFRATVLLTHLHFDHIQGLPFFAPLNATTTSLDIYGPSSGERSLAEVLEGLFCPPHFPVPLGGLPASVRCHDVLEGEMKFGSARVVAAPIPHSGPTFGYRIEWRGTVVAYITDHQAPPDLCGIDPRVLELADDADLVIHDAQYSGEEFRDRLTWGHATPGYAVRVAREAGARRVALFHHDPAHSDEQLDRLLAGARRRAPAELEVLSARDGLILDL